MPSDQEPSPAPREGDRIAKLLARAGIASRREIERMIGEGRVALDGVALDTPATVLRSLAGITVDGKPVAPPAAAQLFLYHKPAGLLVTEHDPAGRPIIYDRLPADLPRVVPVGRLDLATEGLLLLTTDGGLKRQLELPATGVERAYRARAYGEISQAQLEDLADGVEIEGMRYGPINANLERRTGANSWIELILTEGKNREVRRVLEYLGLQVGRLIRTRYGPFILGDLPPGEVGEVKQHDLVAFIKSLSGPRRGKGADLDHLVEVEARLKPPRPAPPPARPAPAPPRAAAPAPRPAVAKPGAGWGSRTRPSRPGEAERPAPDKRALRSANRPPRTDDDRPRPATSSTAPPRFGTAPPRFGTAAPRSGTVPPRSGTAQPRPGTAPPRPGAAPSRPGKGPSGGRGHPPRAPKGGPKRGR